MSTKTLSTKEKQRHLLAERGELVAKLQNAAGRISMLERSARTALDLLEREASPSNVVLDARVALREAL